LLTGKHTQTNQRPGSKTFPSWWR